MLRRLGTAAAAVVLVALFYLSLAPPRPLPPLGPLLDPYHGALGVARSAELPRASAATIPRLSHPVDIRYDDRGVPHIFAQSEADAVRALGYVVARDRLFQLELMARSGAGTLTELVGAAALPLDREIRELGLPDAARRRLAQLADSQRVLLDAYADGVNAWIDGLGADRPLEYLLLGRRPARWSPLHSLNLLGRMGWTLALSDLEDLHERAAARLGQALADALYPVNSPLQEPVEPNGQSAARLDHPALPPPPATAALTHAPGPGDIDPGFDALGSNNWAVAPRRSATGHALLAGDQHLELNLPAIWYEAHLVVADSLDVYGVTIPGAAGIVIGFNRDIAWTFTNTEADVLDRYAEVVDEPDHPTQYRVDGAWRPLRLEIERYLDPHGRTIAVDTMRYTHRGPMTRDGAGWRSLRWTVLEAGGELDAFSHAARSHSAAAFLEAMAGYRAPAQNMLVADRAGTIAIRSTGRFPIRPAGRGDVVQRGDTSGSDWDGDWSLSEVPQSVDPVQGFLASANQQPIDPRMNDRYLGANWLAPWRAVRINELLRGDSAVTPDAMRRYQTDPVSAAAERFVPALLAAGHRYAADDTVRRATALLGEWDLRYTLDNTRAVLYENTMRQLGRLLWDELDSLPQPSGSLLAALLQDSTGAWWDDHRTPEVEDRDRLLARALAAGLTETIRTRGEPDAGGWRWEKIRHANIYHLLRIPALSALDLPIQAGQSTLNPSSGRGTFGPSWRMVVELGPEVHGWGVYPGGQSGNPASSRYLSGLEPWRLGLLDTLRFPATADGLGALEGSRLTLTPAGARR
ncbi:MAG TPA: penicillin acylase family protein [Gemmatimonadales bacterium]|nr:penicillin acylase family protein [Gemmatimonadales bacterium]